jgi:hypothetical protein
VVEIGRQGAETCVRRGRATGHVLFSRMTSRKGAKTLPRGARTANFTSRLPLSIEHLERASLAIHRLGFKLCAQAFLPSEQGRACAPRRKSGGKTQLGSCTRRVDRPAASEPQLPRQASTGGCPRLRGGAKSAMSGELSSDATPLAKGCECESFGSPGTGPGVGGRKVAARVLRPASPLRSRPCVN